MQNENIKYLIVPDVHGRSFWKEPVEDILNRYPNIKIIFLGDYVDPYPYEWDEDTDYLTEGIDRFKEIIELKKANPDRIVLLLGNHCLGYVDSNICSCRSDRLHYKEISNLFLNNRDLFQLAYEDTINGKHIIFSHAGISKKYADFCFGEDYTEQNIVDLFNNAWLTDNYGIMGSLGTYDHFRGWSGLDYASLVWADVREWKNEELGISGGNELIGYNIFGHTQLNSDPIISDTYACLDCRKAFVLTEEGEIQEYKKAEN